MSLIQSFEIGVWNAWVFIIPLLVIHTVSEHILRSRGAGGQSGKIMILMFLILHMLPIFMPLKLDSIWFMVGFILYIFGMIFIVVTLHSFATTPVGKPVTKGVFRISRNPMYFSGLLIFLGIGIASFSWIYVLITILWLIFIHVRGIPDEESECLKKYGKAYREYINKTSKWIGISKS